MKFPTITTQVADKLRGDIRAGHWKHLMPGISRLSDRLGVSRKTVSGALSLLETEGLLENRGQGRRRRIVEGTGGSKPSVLRVAILDFDPPGRMEPDRIELTHRLQEAGHHLVNVPKTLMELGMRVSRVAAHVERIEADAWVVMAGSRAVLEWFADRRAPVFALFGRRRELPIAGVGPDHVKARRELAKRLIGLGHRRIVMLGRGGQRVEGPGAAIKAILEEMEAHGLPTSDYNLPVWDDTADGFHRTLEELFRLTPPTALVLDEPLLFHATREFLAQRGMTAPRHVSLVCADPDPSFAWCRPSVAHIGWSHRPVVDAAVRWARNVARGRDDRRQVLTAAAFVDGGTVGPVPE